MTDSVRAKPDDSAIVRVRGLTTVLNGKTIFDALDLDIPRGKVTAIMGPSGTGKTTLLKHITGQMRGDAGQVTVDGQNVPLGPMIAVTLPRGMSMSSASKTFLPLSTVVRPRMRISVSSEGAAAFIDGLR